MSPIRSAVVAVALATVLAGTMAGAHPARATAATGPARQSDFNGDGYSDLAIGVPGDYSRRGSVNVLYGSSTGLTAAGDQLWTDAVAGLLPIPDRDPAQFVHRFGETLATGDFDRDGYADLAVTVSYRDASTLRDADALRIIHGSPSGLTTAGNQVWPAMDLPGADPDLFDFGPGMTSGDFDDDGYEDLAVGAPAYDAQFRARGSAAILFGGPSGLDAATTRFVNVGEVSFASAFGALASGDLDHDGFDDLVAGVSMADVSGVPAGILYVIEGAADRFATSTPVLWSEDTPGVPGVAHHGNSFGNVLEIGDFDRDGFDDLAVGAPYKTVTHGDAGAVFVLRGSSTGLTATGARIWHQGVTGVPGTPERYDTFGAALAAGDFDGDGADDLAIGTPAERFGSRGCGTVTTLYGTGHGLTTTRVRVWTQDSPGVPGTAENCDRFGVALESTNYGKSRRADLAIGALGESLGSKTAAGVVDVLYGSTTGLRGTGSQGWSQDSPGIKGIAGSFELFGAAFAQ